LVVFTHWLPLRALGDNRYDLITRTHLLECGNYGFRHPGRDNGRRSSAFSTLEVRKLYPAIDDPRAEVDHLIRVVDESGDDYLYPARFFRKLALPAELQRALRTAS